MKFGICDLKKQEYIFESDQTERFKDICCFGKDVLLFLKPKNKPIFDNFEGRIRTKGEGFTLSSHKLDLKSKNFNLIQKFKFLEKSVIEWPVLLALDPRQKHLIVVTSKSEFGELGRFMIFRIDSRARFTFLTCLDFSKKLPSRFNCVQFHGFFKTKLIFSVSCKPSSYVQFNTDLPFVKGNRFYTVLYDFRNKKKAMVRCLASKLNIVRWVFWALTYMVLMRFVVNLSFLFNFLRYNQDELRKKMLMDDRSWLINYILLISWQVSNQCMALVNDKIIVPTKVGALMTEQ